ncbi:MAG: hypothetical protein JW820_09930 [Spirochaetales bacterium]|nr:hypothetical protein [Spirochaetales bacterium]
MIRRLAGRPAGLLLTPEFLQAWLRAARTEEPLLLARERLPERPEPLELWDLWLEQQALLLRSHLPEGQEQSLLQAVLALGGGSLRVQAVPPPGRRMELPADFSGLRGAAAVLEGVRLAWAAVLSAASPAEGIYSDEAQVTVRREGAARPPASTAPAPETCLLHLAALHDRLLRPDSPLPLQSLLDLRPWLEHARAAPDADQERLFLRAAEAAGRHDASELLRRGRQAWAAWVISPAAAAQPESPPAPASAGAGSGCRQLAGLPGAPGLASGRARLLRAEGGIPPLPGEILVCRFLPPSRSATALAAAGLVTERGGSLTYGAVLAARAGIPCVCGARGALARIRDGDRVSIDGRLGIAALSPGGKAR